MKKNMVRGMMVLGVAAMAGMLAIGCSTTGEKKKSEDKAGKGGTIQSLVKWPKAEIIETKVPAVDTTATAVKDVYVTLKALADAQDQVFNANAGLSNYVKYCSGADTQGVKPSDADKAAYVAKLTAEQRTLIADGVTKLSTAGLTVDALTALLTKITTELLPKVTELASDPSKLVTETGFGALKQTKNIAGSINMMRQQLTAGTVCLPVMIEDAIRIELLKREINKNAAI